jgi:sugar transferase (PEP-CTERM/EpsH1 system associated)
MRILLLTHRLPYPPNKGDKIRTFNVLEHLARRHEVFVACPVDDPADLGFVPELERRCAGVLAVRNRSSRAVAALHALSTGTSITVRHFHSDELQRRIDEFLDEQEIDAVCCFSSPMAEYVFRSRHAEDSLRRTRLLMDLIDVDSFKWRQYAERTSFPMNRVYGYEAARLEDYERRIGDRFDELLLVSEQERGYLPAGIPADKVHAISNGVDLAYFSPGTTPVVTGEIPALVFTGVMDYWPNVDGVQWFADEVLPLIRAQVPGTRFVIVGSKPAESVRRLADRPGIEVTGFVDDVRTYVARAHVCVVPLRIARGVQNKVLEAMSMALPVVAMPQAAQGLGALPPGTLRTAATAEQTVDAIAELFLDPARARREGAAAAAFVRAHFRWEHMYARRDGELAALGLGPGHRAPPRNFVAP